MPTLSIKTESDVDIEVQCNLCGANLVATDSTRGDKYKIEVDPCVSCTATERQEADQEGYERGVREAEA